MKNISPSALQQLIESKAAIQLIDVREEYEHNAFNIGGELIPLGEITTHISQIEKEIPVILYCRKGIRSQIAIQKLEAKFPFQNLINLEGGLERWSETSNGEGL